MFDGKPGTFENAEAQYASAKMALNACAMREISTLTARLNVAQIVPPGLYEHWKSVRAGEGPKFYVVFGTLFDVGWEEMPERAPSVAYASLYGAQAGQLVTRPLIHEHDGFLAPINRPNDPKLRYVGPRFWLIEPLALTQMAEILDHLPTVLEKSADRILQLAVIRDLCDDS